MESRSRTVFGKPTLLPMRWLKFLFQVTRCIRASGAVDHSLGPPAWDCIKEWLAESHRTSAALSAITSPTLREIWRGIYFVNIGYTCISERITVRPICWPIIKCTFTPCENLTLDAKILSTVLQIFSGNGSRTKRSGARKRNVSICACTSTKVQVC